MIDTTTRLNTPGPDLAALPGVHALTDVTGFGLAGHALDWRTVPLLVGVRELAQRGLVTGASGATGRATGRTLSCRPPLPPQTVRC